MKEKVKCATACFRDSSCNVKLSMIFMGFGQFRYGARAKGLIYFLIELSVIYYFIMR